MADSHQYYVGMKDHIELRKSLLESSKQLIKSLQRYQKFKALREEKIQKLSRLRAMIRELRRLNGKLRSQMPSMIEIEKHQEEKKGSKKAAQPVKLVQKKNAKPEKVVVAAPVKLTELDRLEKELSEIESKLGRLK